MPSTAPVDVAVAFIEAFAAGDMDALAGYLADDVVFESYQKSYGVPWTYASAWSCRPQQEPSATETGVAWSSIPLACLRLIRRYRIRSGPCVTAHRGRQVPAEGPQSATGNAASTAFDVAPEYTAHRS
jgi:hypothetical protein